MMRILGIDPGTATTGWGALNFDGGKFKVLGCGCILTSKNTEHPVRLCEIYDQLDEIIKREKPDCIAIEKLFFVNNIKTAMSVGEARGVIVLAACKNGLDIYDYTPLEIKQSITGYGKAEKRQIQMMVKSILKLREIPKPDDMADALAAAITHAHCHKIANIKKQILPTSRQVPNK